MYATFDVGTTSMQSFPKNTQEQISKKQYFIGQKFYQYKLTTSNLVLQLDIRQAEPLQQGHVPDKEKSWPL